MAKEFKNKKQIAVQQNSDTLVEFNDHLDPAAPSEISRANVHSGFSKIQVFAKNYKEGTGDKAVDAYLNLDPAKAKYLAREILAHKKGEEFKPFYEQKVNSYKKDEDGLSPVTILNIKYDTNPEKNLPWSISVERGVGLSERSKTGGNQCKAGTFKKDGSVFKLLSDDGMKVMMGEMFDVIRDFETTLRAKCIEADLVELEKERNEKAS